MEMIISFHFDRSQKAATTDASIPTSLGHMFISFVGPVFISLDGPDSLFPMHGPRWAAAHYSSCWA